MALDPNDPGLQHRYQRVQFDFGEHVGEGGDGDVEYRPLPQLVYLERHLTPDSPRTSLGIAPCCIYCGSFHRDETRIGRLSEEHIIPEAIGSRLVIENATCEACDRQVQKYESKVLSYTLFGFARAVGLRSKKSAKRKGNLDFYIGFTGYKNKIKISFLEAPIIMRLPKYLVPLKTTFDIAERSRYCGWVGISYRSMYEIGETIRKRGYNTFIPPAIDVFGFAQFLAKIAYGYAVAIHGFSNPPRDGCAKIGNYDCDIVRYVTGTFHEDGFDKGIFEYVGGIPGNFEPSDNLHEIGCGPIRHVIYEYLVVDIRLFASLAGPLYRVVVGQRLI